MSEVAVPEASGVWTDAQGTILDISEEAARLLARTRRTLLGKSMLLFVGGNRDHVLLAVERASRGHGDTLCGELMPIGRRRIRVRMHLQLTAGKATGPAVLWALEPVTNVQSGL